MNLIVSLAFALAWAWFGSGFIRRRAKLIYILAAVLSGAMVFITWGGYETALPGWAREYVWPLLANCSLATAFFVIVMYTGALPNGSVAIKRLMPIRAELSILACILTLGHNISYGKTYFVLLVSRPERMSGNLLWAAVCSLLLIALMLPLMVTSFPAVRRRMKGKRWKKLQRSAYAFYGLIYIHVMLLNTSFLAAGQREYLLNIGVYSVVFILYAALRIRKALVKKKSPAAGTVPILLAALAGAVVVLICAPSLMPQEETTALSASETTQATVQTQATEQSGETTETTGETEPPAPAVTYIDGTYFGTGEGYLGPVQVAVMVSDGSISSIILVSHSDDKSYMDSAAALFDAVKAAQCADVDVVSGATYSSQGLIEAVDNALASAAQ